MIAVIRLVFYLFAWPAGVGAALLVLVMCIGTCGGPPNPRSVPRASLMYRLRSPSQMREAANACKGQVKARFECEEKAWHDYNNPAWVP